MNKKSNTSDQDRLFSSINYNNNNINNSERENSNRLIKEKSIINNNNNNNKKENILDKYSKLINKKKLDFNKNIEKININNTPILQGKK
jgi:hypothetical protein